MKRTHRGLTLSALTLCAFLPARFATAASPTAASPTAASPQHLIPAAQRQPAPPFTLTDAQGHAVSLAALRGHVVLLNFWATWCGGCKQEIPWYIAFDHQYRAQGLAIVGASMDQDGWAAVRPFLAKKIDAETGGNIAMPYPVVIATPALADSYKVAAMPVSVLIDRQGRIALTHAGVVDRAAFEQDIRQLLR